MTDLRAVDAVQDQIVAEMAPLEDSLRRYEYLVRLGQDLSGAGDGIRREEYAVPGCQSRVWIRAEIHAGRLCVQADSDAAITRGIIALLLRVLDGRTPAEVLEADLYFLDRTGLRPHLSPSRANGLEAMIRRIRSFAEELAEPAD